MRISDWRSDVCSSDLIAAYFALERGFPQAGSNPPAQKLLKLVGEFVRGFFEKAGFAKDTIELGGFMLKAYGTVQLLLAGKTTNIGRASGRDRECPYVSISVCGV